MERFAVVACPKCNWVRGVEIRTKTTACPQCGKRCNLSALAFLATAENERELFPMVAAVRAHLSEDSGSNVVALPRIQKPPQRRRTMGEECIRLSKQGTESFSRISLLEAARVEGITKPEEKLMKLLEEGLLMEPEAGVLVWLGF